jgi:hypothetical protein
VCRSNPSHGDGPAVVHLELLPGDPLDYADALRRAHLFGVTGAAGESASRRTDWNLTHSGHAAEGRAYAENSSGRRMVEVEGYPQPKIIVYQGK